MARNNLDSWVPEENDSEVIQRVNQVSAVERLSRSVAMTSETKSVPRSAGVGVSTISKGGTYGEDTNTNDDVVLTARKHGQAIRIAEEDLADTLVDVIASKQVDWATSYGKYLDNAALAVTAAEDGSSVPYTSVYKELNDNLSANVVQTGTGGIDYENLSSTLGLVEDSDYFEEDRVVVIAHPKARQSFRGVKDDQGNPIFVKGLAGTPDTLFGHEVVWSLGARTSATATDSPSGNPLVVFANRDYLLLGRRSGPESVFIDGTTGASALTDEAILKMRARRGFAVAKNEAFAILEDDS